MLPSKSKVYAEQMVEKVFIWVHFLKVFVSLQEALGRAEALREKAEVSAWQGKFYAKI